MEFIYSTYLIPHHFPISIYVEEKDQEMKIKLNTSPEIKSATAFSGIGKVH